MIGLVIVAHGGLASEYLSALEHIVGKCEGVLPISILPNDNMVKKEKQIVQAVESVDMGYGVIVVTDMHGSTTSNLSIRACNKSNRKVLFGANLPMLVKLIKARKEPFDYVVDAAIRTGKKYIDSVES